VIWPILARYMIALTTGATWSRSPLAARVLWVVVLVALVTYDLRGELRRDRQLSDAEREE
jgi:hypothetical protein